MTAEGLGTMLGCADRGLVKAAGLELPPTGLPEELDFVPCSGPGPGPLSSAVPWLGLQVDPAPFLCSCTSSLAVSFLATQAQHLLGAEPREGNGLRKQPLCDVRVESLL